MVVTWWIVAFFGLCMPVVHTLHASLQVSNSASCNNLLNLRFVHQVPITTWVAEQCGMPTLPRMTRSWESIPRPFPSSLPEPFCNVSLLQK